MVPTDTICAVATAPGVGGVGVVRVSGPQVPEYLEPLLGHRPAPRQASYCAFLDQDGTPLDRGLALYFPQPHSFTGEHVLELQAHGGPVVLAMLVRRVLQLGARAARSGEFTQRAFLNDRLDLAQAEAVADLIESGSEAAARAARQSMDGAFSRRVQTLLDQLIDYRVYVESAMDFPEEEIDFLADEQVASRMRQLQQAVAEVLATARSGQRLRDGIRLAIVGRPNAGKSSLLNALAGVEQAIVTDLPGTTRDVLRSQILVDGMPVHLADTAGLRLTEDRIEAEGVRRARAELANSDLALVVVDDAADDHPEGILDELPEGLAYLLIFNKIDESGHPARREENTLWLSAKHGTGLEALRDAIRDHAGLGDISAGVFSARERHLNALRRVTRHLEQGHEQLKVGAGELLAEELRAAQESLGEITGVFTSDDLLGEIFSRFCIGK